MRISKAEAAANRNRVLEVATRLFREKGIEGVGLADLMSEAGLTHGGFYNHFQSKEELAAEACKVVFDAAIARLQDTVANPGGPVKDLNEVFAHYVRRYLSLEIRDAPGKSCPMATLGTDAARHGAQVKTVFADGVKRYLEAFQNVVPPHEGEGTSKETDREKRMQTIATLSTLIGALTLARAVAGVDEKLSKEILASARSHLLEACVT